MLIEVEEAVCFLSSFLLGKIPRRRIDEFIEILANLLVVRFSETRQLKVWKLVVNVGGDSDKMINKAAAEAQVDASKIRVLWPKHLILELQAGLIRAINAETKAIKQVYPSKQQLVSVANSERIDLRRSRVRETIPQKSCVSNASAKERIQMRVLWACYCDGHSCEPENRPFFETVQDKLIYTAQHFASTRFGSTKPKSHYGHAMSFGRHPFTTPSVLAYSKLLQTLNKLASLPENGRADENTGEA